MRRGGIPGFAAEYGAEAAAGLEDAIVTDWQSSEHSDCGEASQSEWEAERAKHARCGKNALEIRKEEWRSPQVSIPSRI